MRRAHLEEFVQDLPDGLYALIGECSVKLSGGRKQRLAIARVFLKNPPVQKSLAARAKGCTTLVIAHRLATIESADRIIVVESGGIAEHGKLAQSGIYSRLHNAQLENRHTPKYPILLRFAE